MVSLSISVNEQTLWALCSCVLGGVFAFWIYQGTSACSLLHPYQNMFSFQWASFWSQSRTGNCLQGIKNHHTGTQLVEISRLGYLYLEPAPWLNGPADGVSGQSSAFFLAIYLSTFLSLFLQRYHFIKTSWQSIIDQWHLKKIDVLLQRFCLSVRRLIGKRCLHLTPRIFLF